MLPARGGAGGMEVRMMLPAGAKGLRCRGIAIGCCALAVGIIGPATTAAAAPAGGPLASLIAGKVPSASGFHAHYGRAGEIDSNVCSFALPIGQAHCDVHIRLDSRARLERPARRAGTSSSLGDNGAYDPSYLQSAYNVASAAAADGGGAGQIVAIVDAYSDPNIASDLAYYRSFFGLPACPNGTVSRATASCVFEQVSQSGGSVSGVPQNSSWGVEISLDVEMVSAICPKCQILLVEANSASYGNLGTAVNEAVSLGANAVSNSYGGGESSSENSYSLSYYSHPGVAVTASSGDNGYGVEFPAASPTVTAVGGTSLTQLTNGGTRNGSETAWSGAGAGCSQYEPKPSWQTDTGCSKRTVADVSAVADPNTGVWVYDTYGNSGWAIYGGTSVASPIIASFYALAGNAPGSSGTPASYAYSSAGSLYNVTSGSDGTCSPSYLCTAGAGYNGPTGLGTPGGSPNSIDAFLGTPSQPTAPSTPLGLTATAGNGQVSLSWSGSSGTQPITYSIYRSTTSASSGFSLLTSGVTTTSYLDKALSNGTTYYYEVTATNTVSISGDSNVASATPSAQTKPSAPLNLRAVTSSSRGVTLTWSAPSSNGGSSITSYELWRSTSSGQEAAYVSVACTASTCTYNDSNTSRRHTYYYEVAALNGVGEGPLSNQASAVAR
jgi:Fibronectin type III domain